MKFTFSPIPHNADTTIITLYGQATDLEARIKGVQYYEVITGVNGGGLYNAPDSDGLHSVNVFTKTKNIDAALNVLNLN